MKLMITDMFGKQIQSGHIVAVRYVWNSYIGVTKPKGLYAISPDINKAFFSPHAYDENATYQILGHMDETHPDYDKQVYEWYMGSPDKECKCPIKILVYDNLKLPQ